MKLASGHEAVLLDDDELKRQQKDWANYKEGLVRLTPGRWLFPAAYTRYADGIYNFKSRSSDVVIMTYPKCGTTWMQEIVWTMRNNPDLCDSFDDHVSARAPFIDFDMFIPVKNKDDPPAVPFLMDTFNEICPGQNPEEGINLLLSEHIPDPRTIKTHLPFSLMSPSMLDKSKVVSVIRNPKDTLISYYHHGKNDPNQGYTGTLEDYVQYFVDDDLVYGPYWLHLKEVWERRSHPNLHIVYYEELKANPLEEIKKLDTFLDTKLSDQQLEGIVKYTSFSEMKARFDAMVKGMTKDMPAVEATKPVPKEEPEEEKGFFRKGKVGDWKNTATPAMDAKVDEWIKKNLSSIGFDFKYNL